MYFAARLALAPSSSSSDNGLCNHDQEDVLTLGDRTAAPDQGVVLRDDEPRAAYYRATRGPVEEEGRPFLKRGAVGLAHFFVGLLAM